MITLPDEIVRGIYSQQENYDRHLKKTSHHPLGRFDPWVLAEQLVSIWKFDLKKYKILLRFLNEIV